ncbi:hypothetical protein [Arcobacter sp. LA11]|uniref:hypothetical protein n=1 Tax=Arcobacter sp. LA11 TaxID=1898176 RepID=UPI000935513C|nr:hypothetical protein [Arcobacter sp. LA11]
MKKLYLGFILVGALFFSGCASKPSGMPTSYISEVEYQNYDCSQLSLEADEITRRIKNLYINLDSKADGDTVQMGIALVLFWPMLFALEGGDGIEATEYSKLKGELEAIRKASLLKKCDIDFSDKNPDAIIKSIEAEKKENSPSPHMMEEM